MLRAIEQPLPVSSFLHPRSPALCDDCIMQSLQTAITLAPHHPPRVSWLATPPTGTPSTPTTPERSPYPRVDQTQRVHHPAHTTSSRGAPAVTRPTPPPCIPAALAILLSYPAGKPMPARPALAHLYPVAPLLRPAPPLPPAALAPTAPPTRAGCIPPAPCRPPPLALPCCCP